MNTEPLPPTTHEEYIHSVRAIALSRLEDSPLKVKLATAKLVYGVGDHGTRGVCYYNAWHTGDTPTEFIEVCARGEESKTQLAGTTIHELGHVLAGNMAGHSKDWKNACAQLGLNAVSASGQSYSLDHFAEDIRDAIAALPDPQASGKPAFHGGLSMFPPVAGSPLPVMKIKPCSLGIGTRGGKSRGIGSGSRLRLYLCACEKPFRVRIASDAFDATCNVCKANFVKQGGK